MVMPRERFDGRAGRDEMSPYGVRVMAGFGRKNHGDAQGAA